MEELPPNIRARVVPRDAVVEHLAFSDARAMLDQATGLPISVAREFAGRAAGPEATRREVLDAIARLLASGELVLTEADQGVELELPADLVATLGGTGSSGDPSHSEGRRLLVGRSCGGPVGTFGRRPGQRHTRREDLGVGQGNVPEQLRIGLVSRRCGTQDGSRQGWPRRVASSP